MGDCRAEKSIARNAIKLKRVLKIQTDVLKVNRVKGGTVRSIVVVNKGSR